MRVEGSSKRDGGVRVRFREEETDYCSPHDCEKLACDYLKVERVGSRTCHLFSSPLRILSFPGRRTSALLRERDISGECAYDVVDDDAPLYSVLLSLLFCLKEFGMVPKVKCSLYLSIINQTHFSASSFNSVLFGAAPCIIYSLQKVSDMSAMYHSLLKFKFILLS